MVFGEAGVNKFNLRVVFGRLLFLVHKVYWEFSVRIWVWAQFNLLFNLIFKIMKNLILSCLVFLSLNIFSQDLIIYCQNVESNEIIKPQNSEVVIFSFEECVQFDGNQTLNTSLEKLKSFEQALYDSICPFQEKISKTKKFFVFEKKVLNQDAQDYLDLMKLQILHLVTNYCVGNPITVWKRIPGGQVQVTITRSIPFPSEMFFPQTLYMQVCSGCDNNLKKGRSYDYR